MLIAGDRRKGEGWMIRILERAERRDELPTVAAYAFKPACAPPWTV
jgi:hypothetical protein